MLEQLKAHRFPIAFVGISLILGTLSYRNSGVISYSLLLSPFWYHDNFTWLNPAWKARITLAIIAIPMIYLAYKGFLYYQAYAEEADKIARQCKSCQELGAMEMTNKYVTNKQRKFAGYAMDIVNSKQVRRQRHITTEFYTEQWQCKSCGHSYERQKTEKYSS